MDLTNWIKQDDGTYLYDSTKERSSPNSILRKYPAPPTTARSCIKQVDHDAHEITFVASTDTVDRDHERVIPRAFEPTFANYLNNPIVLWAHDHHQPPVARMVDYAFSDEEFTVRDRFAVDEYALAATLWKLYSADEPYMNAVSVGFLPIKISPKEEDKLPGQRGVTFLEAELLEHSLVPIPSNRHAFAKMYTETKEWWDTAFRKEIEKMIDKMPTVVKGTQATNGSFWIYVENAAGKATYTECIPKPPTDKTSDTDKDNISKENSSLDADCHECKTVDGETIKGEALAALLERRINNLTTDDMPRNDILDDMADAAGITRGTVQQILSGSINCPPMQRLEGFAEVLGIDVQRLRRAAERDGCSYNSESDAKPDVGKSPNPLSAEKSVEKIHLGGGFRQTLAGTYERAMRDVGKAVIALDSISDDWRDHWIVGTTASQVVIYENVADEYLLADWAYSPEGGRDVELSNITTVELTDIAGALQTRALDGDETVTDDAESKEAANVDLALDYEGVADKVSAMSDILSASTNGKGKEGMNGSARAD